MVREGVGVGLCGGPVEDGRVNDKHNKATDQIRDAIWRYAYCFMFYIDISRLFASGTPIPPNANQPGTYWAVATISWLVPQQPQHLSSVTGSKLRPFKHHQRNACALVCEFAVPHSNMQECLPSLAWAMCLADGTPSSCTLCQHAGALCAVQLPGTGAHDKPSRGHTVQRC